jgi:hypothetical protein
MKPFSSGLIIFDKLDIICFSFFIRSGMSFLLRKYNERKIIEKKIDPIITELTKESLGMAISVDGKPLKVPLVRGGQIIEKTSLRFLVIKNKTFFAIVKAVMNARRHQRLLKLLQIHLFIINTFLIPALAFDLL